MGLFPDTSERLTALFARSPIIEFDDNDRFIFFSDCHRGDSSWKDDYAPNRHLHLHALNHYFKSGYSYIELGDGDELFMIHDHILGKPFGEPSVLQVGRKPLIDCRVAVMAHENERPGQAGEYFFEKCIQQMGINENDPGLFHRPKLSGALHHQTPPAAAKQAEPNWEPVEIFMEPADGIG